MTEQHVTEVRPRPAPTLSLRVGGACAIVGAVAFGAARLMHGDTPAADARAALEFMATHQGYAIVHVTALLAAVTGVVGMAALAHSFTQTTAWVLGRAAVVSSTVGVAIFGVESTSEGLALPTLANEYTSAVPGDRDDLVRAAEAVAQVTHGPSLVALALLFGASLMLLGIAMVKDAYPSWLGSAGAIVGAVILVTAVGLYLSPDLVPGALLFGIFASVLAQLWLAASGVCMLLRART